MRILHIAFESFNIGGVQKVIMDITENINDYHFDVVIISKETGYMEKQFTSCGGKIFRITEYEGNNNIRKFLELFIKKFRLFFKTYKILKRYGPYDAIHSHNQFRSGITNAAAFFAGVKVRISHGHNDKPLNQHNIFKLLLLNFYRLLIHIFSNVKIACSIKAAKYLFKRTKQVEIIINGVDLDKFNFKLYTYEHSKYVKYIHVGRYNVQKNQLFLLEVFALILRQQKNSLLTLVGFGDDEEIIRNRVKELNLLYKVKMLPPNSNIPKLFANADFMIFPSLYEGFPIVQIEAQVMGVKCFVSDSITTESDLGLSTYIGLDKSPDKWANIILESIKNYKNKPRKQISKEQKKRIDMANICKRYKEIYQATQINKDKN